MTQTRRALNALLACQSFFSEGRSTVSPSRLVRLAAARGFSAVGLVDWVSVAGAVELCDAAREHDLKAVIGATLPVLFPSEDKRKATEMAPLVLLAVGRDGYRALNELITHVNLESPEGVPLSVLLAHAQNLVCLTGGRGGFPNVLFQQRRVSDILSRLRVLKGAFRDRLFVQLGHGAGPHEARRIGFLRTLARDAGLPVLAAPEVVMGEAKEAPLLDALTCGRLGIDVETAHPERPRNDRAHLRDPQAWARLLPFPDGLLNAEKLVKLCHLDLLPERLTPPEPKLPPGVSAQEALEARVFAALPERYQGDLITQADRRLREELATIRSLQLAGFFLTAAEVTDYCREHGILAAGRGSAAGSVVCYLLGITLADPIKNDLLVERFLHTGRESMPDVDIDIASSRRDQVLAWVEERWGQETEAMVANRITYRLPSAVQDLGRALGIPPELRDRLTRALGRDYRHHRPHRAEEALPVFSEVLGGAPVQEQLLKLLTMMEVKFVRHLAPHSGGVVLSAHSLTHYSPMNRSTGGIKLLSFDKDDVEKLGLIKLDLLGLRMLGALERAREEALRLTGTWVEYGHLPDDPAVWARIATGDTMGLFQIESPAQVQMTARLQPRTMTQLAHQIALVRPGPIQSGTVHPYVRRARGEEPVPESREPIRSILASTHGTLMFQEQILRIAHHYSGMNWIEADRFRAQLGKVEDDEELLRLRDRFLTGAARTCEASTDEALGIFAMCAGFRGYGFAESHAHAFALHAYNSAWMRHHHPAAYLAGLLTEAPGMWPGSTIAAEASTWGVTLLPVCLNRSGVAYRAEGRSQVRVPLTAVEGITLETAQGLVLERLSRGKYRSVEDAYDRLTLKRDQFEVLVQAGAFDALTGSRRKAFYALQVVANARAPGFRALLTSVVESPELSDMTPEERLHLDLATKGVSESGMDALDPHRARLRDLGCVSLGNLKHGQSSRTAGLVVAKQRPPTAKGFAFFVIQDQHHRVQVIISPDLWEAHRQLLRDANGLIVQGVTSVNGRAVTLKATHLAELPLGIRRPQLNFESPHGSAAR